MLFVMTILTRILDVYIEEGKIMFTGEQVVGVIIFGIGCGKNFEYIRRTDVIFSFTKKLSACNAIFFESDAGELYFWFVAGQLNNFYKITIHGKNKQASQILF